MKDLAPASHPLFTPHVRCVIKPGSVKWGDILSSQIIWFSWALWWVLEQQMQRCGCWDWRCSMVSSQDVVLKGSWSKLGNPSHLQAPSAGGMQRCLGWSAIYARSEVRHWWLSGATSWGQWLEGPWKYLKTKHSELILFRSSARREKGRNKTQKIPEGISRSPLKKKKKHSQLHKSTTGKGCPQLH